MQNKCRGNGDSGDEDDDLNNTGLRCFQADFTVVFFMLNPKIILILSNQLKFFRYKLLKCIEQYYNYLFSC